MRITDLLSVDSIDLTAQPQSKAEALAHLVDLISLSEKITDKEVFLDAVKERESLGSTGLGDGIATPHAKSTVVSAPALSTMVVPDGMDFEALDGEPTNLFFMIAAPADSADMHLSVLSRLATFLMDSRFREALLHAKTAEEFRSLIDLKEDGNFESYEEPTVVEIEEDYPEILAVTACPTGIAHTFMAAEALETAAKKAGIYLKVETNGSAGVENPLTDEDIEKAKCIIIAADKEVPMRRFIGKKVISVKVSDGIRKADELLQRAKTGEIPLYKEALEIHEEEEHHDSMTHAIYKHLMSGVSHMLPFVIGGGILMALAFLFDTYNPANPSAFGTGSEISRLFMEIGSASFGFMLPVLAGYIAFSIGDKAALAPGFVGGYLANAGNSGFLGALLAGFIAGYVIYALKKLTKSIPKALEGITTVLLYPLIGVFLTGCVIVFLINPPVSAANGYLMSTLKGMDPSSRVFLGMLFGAMMSVDMGGPVNKSAYILATATLADGEYGIMASVMAGGMVPPLAIALSTSLFKNRYTKQEREAGFTNYIMGLSFITEGAIPFAASDPFRVLPSCIIGSAIAGALSMYFNCTLHAPHGGIFVVPTIANPLMYVLAIFTGALTSAILLSLLKKPLGQEKQ